MTFAELLPCVGVLGRKVFIGAYTRIVDLEGLSQFNEVGQESKALKGGSASGLPVCNCLASPLKRRGKVLAVSRKTTAETFGVMASSVKLMLKDIVAVYVVGCQALRAKLAKEPSGLIE